MDLNKLKTFLVVAEQGSVSKAAVELGRTQPAITQAIQLLEESLGFPVLERRKGRVFLTPEGDVLNRAGLKTLGELEGEVAKLKQDLKALSGVIRIGAVLDHGGGILAHRLVTFQKRFPKVRLIVSSGKSDVVESRLLGNEIDVGILINFKNRNLFEIKEFAVEEEILACSPSYLKQIGTPKDCKDILKAALIDMSTDFESFYPWFSKNSKSSLPRLARRFPDIVTETHYGMKEIVLSGFGFAMLPRHMIEEEMKRGQLVQVLKKSKPVRVGIDLAVRKRGAKRVIVELFIEHLQTTRPSV